MRTVIKDMNQTADKKLALELEELIAHHTNEANMHNALKDKYTRLLELLNSDSETFIPQGSVQSKTTIKPAVHTPEYVTFNQKIINILRTFNKPMTTKELLDEYLAADNRPIERKNFASRLVRMKNDLLKDYGPFKALPEWFVDGKIKKQYEMKIL